MYSSPFPRFDTMDEYRVRVDFFCQTNSLRRYCEVLTTQFYILLLYDKRRGIEEGRVTTTRHTTHFPSKSSLALSLTGLTLPLPAFHLSSCVVHTHIFRLLRLRIQYMALQYLE